MHTIAVLLICGVSFATVTLSAQADCCWCDDDTPADAAETTDSSGNHNVYELVMSDEFNKIDRDFANGKDPKWTAIDFPDNSNDADEYYDPSQVTTVQDGEGKPSFQNSPQLKKRRINTISLQMVCCKSPGKRKTERGNIMSVARSRWDFLITALPVDTILYTA